MRTTAATLAILAAAIAPARAQNAVDWLGVDGFEFASPATVMRFTDLDLQLLDFVGPRLANGAVKLLVLLTKADKLNRRDGDRALQQARDTLAGISTEASDIGVTLFSALNKRGVDDTAVVLRSWVASLRPAAEPAA